MAIINDELGDVLACLKIPGESQLQLQGMTTAQKTKMIMTVLKMTEKD